MEELLAFLLSPVLFAGIYSGANAEALQSDSPRGGEATAISYVDPKIGSEGEGRVFIGPSMPFGMVKPSPDCGPLNNSGWAPMPAPVNGFSQTHVSGTGGGPKYGNILIQPFCSRFELTSHPQQRVSEYAALGRYVTTYQNGTSIQFSASNHAAYYRIDYPADSLACLTVDAGWFLGNQSAPDLREQQQFVASEIEMCNEHEIRGFSRIRGGWNNGRAYTVYFCLLSNRAIKKSLSWDHQGRRGMNVEFAGDPGQPLQLQIGISFVGERKARQNAQECQDYQEAELLCRQTWGELLGRIEIDKDASESEKRMFYTGLYHTLLEPADRTDENPLWTDYENGGYGQEAVPYYDDFYAIWDTYRTSSPLITLIDPARQTDIVRSLINIGQRDGYMPDARSGNSNGRTQGGSNAEIVLADAFVKGLHEGIDWEAALREMLKDATLPPGGNQEAEGRGGLTEYLRLGYVPFGIDRSGTRTMEYAFCDYAIAQVAKGLGRPSLYEQYMRQSGNWKNLWRADYEHDGTKGFIMPRAADGTWLDTLTVGHSQLQKPQFVYTPVTNESPWNQAWWGTVFYEATSWEYSLSVPHDVPGLIALCGGEEAFERRLDTFFDRGYYNVNNEPSFLTPCLYHWLGKPERTSDRVHTIIAGHFDAGARGLPGNDDSGAMSSWLAFHMMGLYPNAGTDQYLLHTPVVKSTTLHLANGRDFTIRAPKLSSTHRYIVQARLNGADYPWSSITHATLMEGGVLELVMGKKPGTWGRLLAPSQEVALSRSAQEAQEYDLAQPLQMDQEYRFDFDLRTQHRLFTMRFVTQSDSLRLDWQLPRGERVQEGSYAHSRQALRHARSLSYEAPTDRRHFCVPDESLFMLLSVDALREAQTQGWCQYNGTRLQVVGRSASLLHLRDHTEGYEMWVNNSEQLPVVVKMKNNPVEIDWEISILCQK